MDTELLYKQIDGLEVTHFLILYWTAVAEGKGICYNITNVFDDLKFVNMTRTKQSAMSFIDVLKYLQFIEVRDEGNRKNLYISKEGGSALERMVKNTKFSIKKSIYLEAR